MQSLSSLTGAKTKQGVSDMQKGDFVRYTDEYLSAPYANKTLTDVYKIVAVGSGCNGMILIDVPDLTFSRMAHPHHLELVKAA